METITIHKAKTQLSRLIERACKGEEIVIARGKQPVVKLVALPTAHPGKRTPGALKGKISYTADAFDPLTDREMKDLGFE
jgi:antitoxin (DNA-binding transcriptional repressor) of toxin-antitoxin stability system